MQPDLARQIIRMQVERILDEVWRKETGAARLQQVGLFTLIYMLQGDDESVTARRLATMTGQSEGQVGRLLEKLIDLELVERVQILAKHGRGRAFNLVIKHNAKTKRLLKAIDKGTAKKR